MSKPIVINQLQQVNTISSLIFTLLVTTANFLSRPMLCYTVRRPWTSAKQHRRLYFSILVRTLCCRKHRNKEKHIDERCDDVNGGGLANTEMGTQEKYTHWSGDQMISRFRKGVSPDGGSSLMVAPE